MAPHSKFTSEQLEMMEEYQEKYLECQAAGDYTPFWAPFFEDYHSRWPEREHLFPDIPLDTKLTTEQKVANANVVNTRKKQLIHRFRNTYGNYSAKRKMKAQTTSSVEKMLVSQLSLKGTRTLQPAEAYSKLYYKTRIKPVIDAEMKVLKQEAGLSPMTSDEEGDMGNVRQTLPKKVRLSLVKKHTRTLFENETPKIKSEVADFIKKWSEDRKRSSSEDKDISFTENIENLPKVLADIFAGLAKQMGWAFSVLMGGPSPGMGGKIQIESFHVVQTAMGNTFNCAYSDCNEHIMKPYADLLSRPFVTDVTGKGTPFEAGSAITTLSPMPIDSSTTINTSLLPPLSQMIPFNDHQCGSFSGLDISGPESFFNDNGPILPMPEGNTLPTAKSMSSLELYDSAALDRMSVTDLLNEPLGPNWPDLPSNQAVISNIELPPLLQPNIEQSPPPMQSNVKQLPPLAPPLMQPNVKQSPPLMQQSIEQSPPLAPNVEQSPPLAPPLMQPNVEQSPPLTPPLMHPNIKQSPPLTPPLTQSDIKLPPPLMQPNFEPPQPLTQPVESLVLGRSKRECKESTRNNIANSIGNGKIGKDNSTSKKQQRLDLMHGAPAR
ncbi:uncharacterized protein EDB93DRAFT_1254777 [Suillus bovinus]|uniref:uncharacterized protein n=1 Tax=Suillus bovinus TaxID=48563 RepID=UPI001B867D1E|nr:uncharacterized protein EDB93DRAFT_1254777 [Suillus bovinus]KAG2133683.1 hypothetical protein EDB93DRAFT_1254777 [Suillus bovinus]